MLVTLKGGGSKRVWSAEKIEFLLVFVFFLFSL